VTAAAVVWGGQTAAVSQWHLGGEAEQVDGAALHLVALGADEPLMPVFRVTAREAHECAQWLGGFLPGADEWDRAAGVWEKPARLSPFPGDWSALPPDQKALIAVNRRSIGPMRLDQPTIDRSCFDCLHMSGNGYEWTNTMAVPEGWTLAQSAERGFAPSDRVLLRGRDYAFNSPLVFSKMEDAAASSPPEKPSPKTGFRVALHP
jgi:formylglycine-generating enzyme required for sulfatase activity